MKNNGRKYPSQEDAQLLIDIMNNKGVYFGACSPEFRAAGEKFNGYPPKWQSLYTKAFGDKSPWNYKDANGKRVLYWDKDKAAKLKI